MKTMKKVCANIIVLVMMLALGITAHAAGAYTITINNSTSGHVYEAYQIFTGDLSGDVLSNVQWGTGVDGTALLAALKADGTVGSTFAACATAADVAAAMSGMTDDAAAAQAIAQIVGSNLSTTIAGTSSQSTSPYTITPLDAGYYLVKDQDDTQLGQDDAYTRFILEVVNDVTVTPKSGTSTMTKTVDDINDSTNEGMQEVNSADYDIGDTVPFTLTGTLPSNYGDYTSYKYIFHDRMLNGLSFMGNVTVYIDDIFGIPLDSSYYTVVDIGLTDGCTFEVRFDNLKNVPGITKDSKIIVRYNALLLGTDEITSMGYPNFAHLEYSNNPNVGGEGDTGSTFEEYVPVCTYQVIINKVDKNSAALPGAVFTLEKYYDDMWKVCSGTANTEGTTFTFRGLDEGRYRLTETTTPAGYNTIEPIYFTITAMTNNMGLNSLTAVQTDAAGTELTQGIIATFATDLATASVTTNVTNNTGATLPSTGGIGTTVFYVAGGLVMISAVVLLISKKRKTSGQ